jgi:hypothetical protein
MATQLSLYNGALRILKERKLASLTENREPRRVLDDVYESTVKACLEQGLWNFATRTAKFTAEVGFVPAFGYKNQFIQPSDYVRLAAISTDEYFNSSLTRYTDEDGSWYADEGTIYVSYISNDVNYGGALSKWPETFTTYVETYLATMAGGRITGNDMDDKLLRKALVDARSKDAMNEPTKFMPQGRWTQARGGGVRRDRGSRNTLIG